MIAEIHSSNLLQVTIVGGGTCGLAVAARLCEHTPGAIFTDDEHLRFHWLRQRAHSARTDKTRRRIYSGARLGPHDILVLDSTADRFLGQWDALFAACQIPHLRSPMFFHPDPGNIDAMVAWAHLSGREAELKEIPRVVGREYLKHQQKRMRRQAARTPHANHDHPGLVDVNMREWKDYYRPSTRFFHDFCQRLIDDYRLGDRVRREKVVDIRYGDIHLYDTDVYQAGFIITTASGETICSKMCVVASGHEGKVSYPKALEPASQLNDLSFMCHTTHLFSGAASFPPPIIEARLARSDPAHLVIVGGGLTSAQLAHVACLRGIPTTLILRGSVKVKHFDFHLDWVTKYRNVKKASFYQSETDEERLELMNAAREGGLVNPEYHLLLKKHCALGQLRMLRHTTISEGQIVSGRWSLKLTNATSESLALSLDIKPDQESSDRWIVADYVCCATGVQADFGQLSFMKSILRDYPIDMVQGYPCLTENLQWNEELPLYVVGKNAALQIGPTSANLDGARLGAERIGWKIQNDLKKEVSPGVSLTETELLMAGNNMNRYLLLQEV